MRSNFSLRNFFIVLFLSCLSNFVYSQATCATAVPLTPSVTCSPTQGDLQDAVHSNPIGSCGGATATTTKAVWFTFTATSPNATITVSNLGSNLTAATTYIELLTGTCPTSFSVIACQNASTALTTTLLNPGTVYYLRVYVTGTTTGNPSNRRRFDICIQSSPNDDPASATALTPAPFCTGLAGTLSLATVSGSLPSGCETVGNHWDVWYKFTAANTTSTITISTLGANFTNPEIQLYSGTIGSFTSMQCGTTTITNSSLTIGTTYYLRVSNVNVSAPAGTVTYNICITYPPVNDECNNATVLYSNTSCINTSATLAGAMPSAGIPLGCAAAGSYYDVWFSFTAASAVSETITLSNLSGISAQRIQLYSGSCGSLTSVACSSTSILTATGLSVGATYYVRVSNFNVAATSTGNFNICITHPAPTIPSIDYGKSYVNITNNTGGGTIDTGDTLEIRATLVIRSSGLDSLVFLDTLHLGGGVRLVPGSIALRTNEGKVYKSFTDAVGDDGGSTYTSGTDTVIRINFGTGASATRGGTLTNTSKPSVFGSTMIIMATYRVVVYAGYNTTLNLGGGKFISSPISTGSLNNLSFSQRNAIVYSSPGLCPNAVAASNAIGGDFNGTFGSGAAQNRGASSSVSGYTYSTFTTGAPGDYYYGIANNTSAGGSSFTTTTTWAKPDNSSPTHRVFNLWDITGDHTGATNTAKGNLPCDPSQPISAANPCGYMLVVNSAYKTDTAFQFTVSNLCPNTYYELSAWVKNICYKCGCDSNGVAATGAAYIPTAINDSSGVRPNLTFDINGIDYYTTGDILYGGLFPSTQTGSDSNNVWVKRGFTYLTGAAQTSFTLTIRNNAPGGGGNDWAMDDIALATCSPNMNFTPSIAPYVCDTNIVEIGGTVRSYFNNYVNYKWQKSIDNGATWNDDGAPGVGTPALVGSEYEYTVNYPQFLGVMSDSGHKYRLVVGTTPSNLSSAVCTLTGNTDLTLNIHYCTPILGTDFISFNAKQDGLYTFLKWTTNTEMETLEFVIEGSEDGRQFTQLAVIKGNGNSENILNSYGWPHGYHQSKYYYRIKMKGVYTGEKYSRIISLDGLTTNATVVSVVNPFRSQLNAEIQVKQAGIVKAQLINNNGMIVQTQNFPVQPGTNRITLKNLDGLSAGMYTLKIISNQNSFTKKVVKQ